MIIFILRGLRLRMNKGNYGIVREDFYEDKM